MRRTSWVGGLMIPLLMTAPVATLQSQGKGEARGHEKTHERGRAVAKGQGNRAATLEPRQRGHAVASERRIRKEERPTPAVTRSHVQHVDEFGGEVASGGFHVFAASNKPGERMAGRVVARATTRGLTDDDFVISPVGNNVYILNRSGALLVNLNDDFELGSWRAVVERDRGRRDAPSFCRSGAGHPVWGRQWCIEKGFGLGDDEGYRWARAIDMGDVTFRRDAGTKLLDRDALLAVLGDVVFNRLATHAVTLGLVDPLLGQWIGEGGASRVMLVTSGTRPIAEIVDNNHDNRADLLVVAVKP